MRGLKPTVDGFSIFYGLGQLNGPLTWRVRFSSKESFSMAEGTLLYDWYVNSLPHSTSKNELRPLQGLALLGFVCRLLS